MNLKHLSRLGLMSVVIAIMAYYKFSTKQFDGKIEVKRAGRSGPIENTDSSVPESMINALGSSNAKLAIILKFAENNDLKFSYFG